MKGNMSKRSNVHLNTLPTWPSDNLLEEYFSIKDPRETLEAIKKLQESGTKGPNLYYLLATIGRSSIKLKIPETLIKLPHQSTVYLYNDEKGFVKCKTDEK